MSKPDNVLRFPRGIRAIFEYVAAWQFLSFILLIVFVWASEVVDLKHVVFGAPHTPVDWLQASLISAAILAVGVITVGHTYTQARQILRGLIIVCSYCRKVQVEETVWQQMELYVARRSKAEFSHGVCPGCLERMSEEIEAAPPVHRPKEP